ncbi:hypothetical protein ACP70R_024521 [Stipagrostis hirtigluma subsp. patula]
MAVLVHQSPSSSSAADCRFASPTVVCAVRFPRLARLAGRLPLHESAHVATQPCPRVPVAPLVLGRGPALLSGSTLHRQYLRCPVSSHTTWLRASVLPFPSTCEKR